MIDLEKITQACNLAIEDADDNFANSIPFFQMADPRAVLELVQMARFNTAAHELERMLTLIRDLSACLEAAPDQPEFCAADSKAELLRQASCVLAIYDTEFGACSREDDGVLKDK